MKRLLVLACLVLISTGMKKRQPVEPTPQVTIAPSPKATPSPVPSGQVSNIGFRCTSSCTKEEAKRVAEAQIVANQIVHTECFSKFMSKVGLLDEDGEPFSAKEAIKDITTEVLTVPVHYYYSRANVVGYRNIGAPDIYFNRRYHDYYNACDTASNAVHEWSHSLGYGHPFNPTSWRGRTIPYAINQAFDACCSDSQGFRGVFEVK